MLDARGRVIGLIDERRDEIVGFLKDLVGIPSVTGDEAEIQAFISRKLDSMDLEVDVWEPDLAVLERHPAFVPPEVGYDNRPNVVGIRKGAGGGRSLLFNGHVDVIPPGPPTSCEVQRLPRRPGRDTGGPSHCHDGAGSVQAGSGEGARDHRPPGRCRHPVSDQVRGDAHGDLRTWPHGADTRRGRVGGPQRPDRGDQGPHARHARLVRRSVRSRGNRGDETGQSLCSLKVSRIATVATFRRFDPGHGFQSLLPPLRFFVPVSNGVPLALGRYSDHTCPVSQSFEDGQLLFHWTPRLGPPPRSLVIADALKIGTHGPSPEYFRSKARHLSLKPCR